MIYSMYISTNEVEQKAMRNMQHSHIQCVTLRKNQGREDVVHVYLFPPFHSPFIHCQHM